MSEAIQIEERMIRDARIADLPDGHEARRVIDELDSQLAAAVAANQETARQRTALRHAGQRLSAAAEKLADTPPDGADWYRAMESLTEAAAGWDEAILSCHGLAAVEAADELAAATVRVERLEREAREAIVGLGLAVSGHPNVRIAINRLTAALAATEPKPGNTEVDRLKARVGRLEGALRGIADDAPESEPDLDAYPDKADEAYALGANNRHWFLAEIARAALAETGDKPEGGILEAIEELREAGGKTWDNVEDVEAELGRKDVDTNPSSDDRMDEVVHKYRTRPLPHLMHRPESPTPPVATPEIASDAEVLEANRRTTEIHRDTLAKLAASPDPDLVTLSEIDAAGDACWKQYVSHPPKRSDYVGGFVVGALWMQDTIRERQAGPPAQIAETYVKGGS